MTRDIRTYFIGNPEGLERIETYLIKRSANYMPLGNDGISFIDKNGKRFAVIREGKIVEIRLDSSQATLKRVEEIVRTM